MAIFHFYSPVHFEPWSWRNSIEHGIGGSETCHIELCWRLARRGHEVISYSPLPKDETDLTWRGVAWRDLADADFKAPGTWVVFRDARPIDDMVGPGGDQRIWLICQDESPIAITPERAEKCEKIVAFCQWHRRHLTAHWPCTADKLVISTNGLKPELVRATLADPPERQPHRLIYASSPDRGLVPLLENIFPRVREFVPDVELHCFYGTDNIRKLMAFSPQFQRFRSLVARLERAVEQPGVTWHGRVDQPRLYREMAASSLWVYPNTFTETSCIQCMEQQALGAVPVTRPLAALAENVMHGAMIQGDPGSDPLTQARYVQAIVLLLRDRSLQERLRRECMAHALDRFNWERVVDQYEAWLYGHPESTYRSQYAFQLKHAVGDVLNVGCNIDVPGFGERGGTNIDVRPVDPITGWTNKAHALADARCLPTEYFGRYDTVVLGEILEHMERHDRRLVLDQARACLRPAGRVAITCPDDDRPLDQQAASPGACADYAEGIPSLHHHRVSLDELEADLTACGLRVTTHQVIDYGAFAGHGLVAEVAPC